MLLVDDLAAGGTKNLRHTPRGLVTLFGHMCKVQDLVHWPQMFYIYSEKQLKDIKILLTL